MERACFARCGFYLIELTRNRLCSHLDQVIPWRSGRRVPLDVLLYPGRVSKIRMPNWVLFIKHEDVETTSHKVDRDKAVRRGTPTTTNFSKAKDASGPSKNQTKECEWMLPKDQRKMTLGQEILWDIPKENVGIWKKFSKMTREKNRVRRNHSLAVATTRLAVGRLLTPTYLEYYHHCTHT